MLTKEAVDHLEKYYKYTGNNLDRVLVSTVFTDVLPYQGSTKLTISNLTKYFKQKGIKISKDARGDFYYNKVDAGELKDTFMIDKLKEVEDAIKLLQKSSFNNKVHFDIVLQMLDGRYHTKYVDIAAVCRQLGFSTRRNVITFRKG